MSIWVATAVTPIQLAHTLLHAKGSTAFKEKELPKDNFTALTFSLAIEWYHQNIRVVI